MPLHRQSVGQYPGLQVATDESQHATIADALRKPTHQHVVIDPVEKLFQIHVHHDATALLDIPLRLDYRVVRAPAWPKPVAVL